ncbi:MAG TPA: shikimate kinase [Candidatus Methanoperedenaceae archaeon]|nr:shikimate kinase [Candidatus Methanoperedenaceae archaeon]
MRQTGCAYALGAGTVINAIATWKGAAFGIDIRTEAEVTLSESGKIKGEIEGGGDTRLIERCVELVLARFGRKSGALVRTKSEIPIASGLKSSSAAANATVLATLDALGESLPALEVVKIGVQAALDTGVTITGAFDDACASFFGGMVITDNRQKELLRREEMESDVVILAPEKRAFSSDTNVARSRLLAPWVELAFGLAMEKDYERAMTLNGFLYCSALGFDTEPMLRALEAGARCVSLSGTGPSYVALAEPGNAGKLNAAWEPFGGRVINTKINNDGAGTCR